MQKIFFLFLLPFLAASCAKLPVETNGFKHSVYDVLNGPEDFVLDTSSFPRLIVSCGVKRKNDASKGGFFSIFLNSKHVEPMKVFMPDSIALFPHGIDLVKQNDSLILLAVNHEYISKKKTKNSVLRFLLKHDRLYFIQQIAHSEMKHPNAVCGMADGSFFFSNMYTSNMLSKGNITYCKNGNCNAVSRKIRYANGVALHNNKLYVASTLEDKIFSYAIGSNGMLQHENVEGELKGGDNLRIVNNKLYCAAHLKLWAFIKHFKNFRKHSPSAVYEKDLITGKSEIIYFNNGSVIDASSTAIKYKNKIYITGVFDPEVVEIETK
jgi:hypothetical protein